MVELPISKELIIAGDKGPCGGVNMALDTTTRVLDIVEGREAVYANHNPVHNDPILQEYKERGLVVEPDIESIPEGSIYILSAHGTPPSFMETAAKKGLLVVNVECQYVSKVRRRAESSIDKNEHVVYFGARNHPEPAAVLRDLDPNGYTFVDIDDNGPTQIPDGTPIRVLNQTTLSTTAVYARRHRLETQLGIKLPEPIGICYATDNRQRAVRDGIFGDNNSRPDALVVVGSRDSHNSKELTKIGAEVLGADKAFQIDEAEELREEWFREATRVGLTSGASVLDRFTEPVIAWFKNKGYKINLLPSTERELMFKGPSIENLRAHLERKYAGDKLADST